jgi:uncharacterized membrane protein
MFNFFRKKPSLLTEEQSRIVVKAIRHAEKTTSGEIRVFIENRCSWVDPIDRAAEIFFNLNMDKTEQRNAVLVYLALKDRQVAVFGDKGIHEKLNSTYWNEKVQTMLSAFRNNEFGVGIAECVIQIGETLHQFFPYHGSIDKNELPDEIVFGN